MHAFENHKEAASVSYQTWKQGGSQKASFFCAENTIDRLGIQPPSNNIPVRYFTHLDRDYTTTAVILKVSLNFCIFCIPTPWISNNNSTFIFKRRLFVIDVCYEIKDFNPLFNYFTQFNIENHCHHLGRHNATWTIYCIQTSTR